MKFGILLITLVAYNFLCVSQCFRCLSWSGTMNGILRVGSWAPSPVYRIPYETCSEVSVINLMSDSHDLHIFMFLFVLASYLKGSNVNRIHRTKNTWCKIKEKPLFHFCLGFPTDISNAYWINNSLCRLCIMDELACSSNIMLYISCEIFYPESVIFISVTDVYSILR